MADVAALRTALLALHRELLRLQRIQTERITGRMSAGEVLQAAADDLRFDWIRTVSELISELDEARSSTAPESVEALVERARDLFAPPDPTTAFGARYLEALQREPAVVLAHRDVTAAL